jgi:hypothetical protein
MQQLVVDAHRTSIASPGIRLPANTATTMPQPSAAQTHGKRKGNILDRRIPLSGLRRAHPHLVAART